MKLVLALALLVPGFAQASPAFWCKEENSGIDHGMWVNFSSPIKSATISEQSIAGPRVLAELTCAYNAIPEDHTGNYPYVTCSEPKLRDAGYSLVLDTAGATVYQVTIAGSKAVAHLKCGRR